MEQKTATVHINPWKEIKLKFGIRNFGDTIEYTKQGLSKTNKYGEPINNDDADFMITVGITTLTTDLGFHRKYPSSHPLENSTIKEAEKLILENGERVAEYRRNLKELPEDKAELYNHVGILEAQLRSA